MEGNHSSEARKRTILYYPTMSIPNDSWLRQALLYWDEIGSIVPEQLEESGEFRYPKDIEFLRREGEYRPFRPEVFTSEPRNSERLKWLTNEFLSTVDSDEFRRVVGADEHGRVVRGKSRKLKEFKIHENNFFRRWGIYSTKVSRDLLENLAGKGLIEVIENPRRDRETGKLKEPGWIWFEENTALLYMSLLAKYIADVDIQSTVVGTDDRRFEKLLFAPESPKTGFACIDIRFPNVLPVPRDDAPILTILKFKRKRKQELINLILRVAEFEKELSKAEDVREVKEIVFKFSKEIEISLSELARQMNEVRMPSVAGSMKSLISAKEPTFWAGLGLALGIGPTIATLPVTWIIAGASAVGVITIGVDWISKRNETIAKVNGQPFALLYHAKAAGLVST